MELVLESEEATSVAKDDGTGTVGEASCDLSTMNKDFLGIGAIEDKSKTPSLSLWALATCLWDIASVLNRHTVKLRTARIVYG